MFSLNMRFFSISSIITQYFPIHNIYALSESIFYCFSASAFTIWEMFLRKHWLNHLHRLYSQIFCRYVQKTAGILTYCEDFLGIPAENMQTRCVKWFIQCFLSYPLYAYIPLPYKDCYRCQERQQKACVLLPFPHQ